MTCLFNSIEIVGWIGHDVESDEEEELKMNVGFLKYLPETCYQTKNVILNQVNDMNVKQT